MNYYSKIPPLNVVVKNKKCSLILPIYIYIPISGKSLPIFIDFSTCLPLSDVTITAKLF